MVTAKRICVALAAAALLVAGVWYFLIYSSEEATVRRRVERFGELLARQPESGNIAEALANQQLSGIIADGCVVKKVDERVDGVYSPAEFASLVTRAHALCSKIDVDFDRIEVEVSGASAHVALEAGAKAEFPSGACVDEERDLTIELKKIDGEWKITSLAAIPMLTGD